MPSDKAEKLALRGFRRPAIEAWPFVVSDAPLRCALCAAIICGTGVGTVYSLKNVIRRHKPECPGRFGEGERRA